LFGKGEVFFESPFAPHRQQPENSEQMPTFPPLEIFLPSPMVAAAVYQVHWNAGNALECRSNVKQQQLNQIFFIKLKTQLQLFYHDIFAKLREKKTCHVNPLLPRG